MLPGRHLSLQWLAAALWVCAGALAQARTDPPFGVAPIRYTHSTLPNGLQVIAVPSRHSPTVSVQVWYRVGSRDDPPGRSGFAHLFEHLMFKGSRYLQSEQFDRLTDDVGGSNNAFTSNDMTVFESVVPSNHLEVLLWAEAERMSNLGVNADSFESERAVVEEEFRQRVLATPYGRLGNGLPGAAYQVHPYGRPTIGRIEDLEAATLEDVLQFHSTYYRPDNATLVVAGDFDADQLTQWVVKYFGGLTRPSAPLPRPSQEEPAWRRDRRVDLTGPHVPLPAVALVWLAPSIASADAAALEVMSGLLSSGESSRLNQSLVYRQQIASDASFDADLRVGPGLLTATATAASNRPLQQVIEALWAQLQRLATAPIAEAELSRVKAQMLTAALQTRETPDGLAAVFGEAATLAGDPERVNSDLLALQRVSAADVQRVVKRYVLRAHHVVVRYTQAPTPDALLSR